MLAQLLEQKGLATLSFPIVGSSPNEWIALIEAGRSDVVCISALPPYAFAPARAMCKQIRERFPKLKVVVCVWGFSGDTRTKPRPVSSELNPIACPLASRRPWSMFRNLFALRRGQTSPDLEATRSIA